VKRHSLLLLLAVALALPTWAADEVHLLNGDRITGRVIGRTTRRVRLSTPYGTLTIPRSRVQRIVRSDGTEEVLSAPPAPPAPPPPPPPPPVGLRIEVSGASFWQAWDPKAAPSDPSLRLEVRLDDAVVASYVDANLDPEDLPKAVVNSFVFSPARLFVGSADGVETAPPEVSSGTIGLPLRLPAALAGPHRLSIAYQVNESSSSAPRWTEVVRAACEVTLEAGATLEVRLVQDRGTMEFTRRHMRDVESFRATLEPVRSPPSP
jgi:hypothetical protein